MISSCATTSQAIRKLAALIVLVLCCVTLPVGCGDPGTQQSSVPKEFGDKLEKEKPELFIKKTGKKTEVLGGRDRRAVIRREQEKARQQ